MKLEGKKRITNAKKVVLFFVVQMKRSSRIILKINVYILA